MFVLIFFVPTFTVKRIRPTTSTLKRSKRSRATLHKESESFNPMIETTDVSNDVGFELGTLSVNLDALAKEELVQDLRVPPPTSKDLRAAAEIDTNTDQDADERDSVVICGHSFSVNQPSRRSTIDTSGVSTAREVAAESTVPGGGVVAKQSRRSSFSDAI